MPEHIYRYSIADTANGHVTLAVLESELRLAMGEDHHILDSVWQDEDTMIVFSFIAYVPRPMLDAVVSSHVGGPGSLDALKAVRYSEIDKKTEELIVSGFVYKGKLISSSHNAQQKWHAILNMGQLGQLTYPLAISAKDESEILLLSYLEVVEAYASMVGTGKSHFDSGKALKDQVLAADTLAEVAAVEDNR